MAAGSILAPVHARGRHTPSVVQDRPSREAGPEARSTHASLEIPDLRSIAALRARDGSTKIEHVFPSSEVTEVTEVDQEYLEQMGLEWLGSLAGMGPQDRFEQEFGVPATPDAMTGAGFGAADSVEEVACGLQEFLMQSDGLFRIAEARRVDALLRAYEASLADLAARFGVEYGTRQGRGASVFFTTIGLRMRQHPLRVAHLVDTGLLLRDRLPKTWAVFLAGATTWWAVDLAVQQANGLDREQWAAYDDVASGAVGSSNRLKDLLRKTRERLQGDTAGKRAKTTEERLAVFVDPGADGGSTWSMTGPAADQQAWDAALTKAAIAAKVPGETRTVTQLRYDIARDLLVEGLHHDAGTDTARSARGGPSVPQRKGVQVQLVLTIPALAWLGHSTEQALLAGYGPIAMDTAKQLAGQATSFVRVWTDPVTGVRLTMDRTARSAPADLRRWLIVRDQWCRFPGCRRTAQSCDTDHLTEWHDHGVTDEDNLLSECRRHHRDKTLRLLHAELDTGGWARWTDPWNNHFTDPPAEPMDPTPARLLPGSADDLCDPDEPAPF